MSDDGQPLPGPRWRHLSDADREREYSPSSMTGGSFDRFIDDYASVSATGRDHAESLGLVVQEVRYGPGPANTVDLVTPPCPGPHPLLVYIHGGYWQLLSKRESFFAAADCLEAGVAFATVDYTLAPTADLDTIVAECRAAVTTLRDEADGRNIDQTRIVVAGSSAGGHLTAMVGLGLNDGWRPAAVAPISGVFELEPLLGTTINDAVGLDLSSATRNSPMLSDLAGFPPSVVAWGDNETDEFKRQSTGFAARIRAAVPEAGPVTLLEVDGRNHFDVVMDLCNRQTPLGRALLELIARTADNDA